MKKRNEHGGTQPIKNPEDLQRFRNFYLDEEPDIRSYTMIIIGLNTALRISDIINMKWGDLYSSDWQMKSHFRKQERKTGKVISVLLNKSIQEAVPIYKNELEKRGVQLMSGDYVFPGRWEGTHLTRGQAYRIVKHAAVACGMEEHISCHSLRKTFGYHAQKRGVSPALLMDIYNHSSYDITKRYLCLDQDDRDRVYSSMEF